MAEKENNRYIDITDYTRVGYNYIKGQFYVTNKASTTYRNTVSDIQNILHSLNITTVTDEEIESCKTTMEVVTNIYYTMSDIGSYISSLQFNDFKDYPIILNCEKSKLYIQNSTVIFDLTTKESPKIVRVPKLCSFYKETLGLSISQRDMLKLYELLVSYYNPTCYVHIEDRESMEDPLYYGDTLAVSNYSGDANAVYNWKYNPFNTTVPTDIADIVNIDTNTNTITLLNPIPSTVLDTYNISTGSTIIIEGTDTIVNGIPYTCDGTYIIDSIEENTIALASTLPTNYTFPYYTCSLILNTYSISNISRDSNSITVSTSPDDILVGNTITVLGTTISTEYETITCDGTYTVNNVQGNTIYVNEIISTNYTGNLATLYKVLKVEDINKIENNTIYFNNNVEVTLNHEQVMVYNNSINKAYTVIEQGNNYITVEEDIEDYTPIYPQVQYPIPSSEVMVTVTYIKEQYEEKLPLGSFVLNTPEQARTYIAKYSAFAKVPDADMIHDVYTKYKGGYDINLDDIGAITLEFQGLYTEIYGNKEDFSRF